MSRPIKNQNIVEKDPKLQARTYSCRFLRSGPVQYENEIVAIYPENLMKIADAFKGFAVVIDHVDLDSGNADKLVVGYISEVWKNEGDEWAWCNFLVDNKNAIDLIENGCFVSCAYIPTETKTGGTYNNIEYQREIVGGKPLHLALVTLPRYEGAEIIKNSKEDKKMLKFFRNSKKEIDIDAVNTTIEVDGEEVSLQNAIEAFKNAKVKKNKAKMNESDEVDVDGEMVKVADLKKAYSASKKKNTKKNEGDEDKKDEKENDADEDDMENEGDEDKKDEKENGPIKDDETKGDPTKKNAGGIDAKLKLILKQQEEIGKNIDTYLGNSKDQLSTEQFETLKNAKMKYESTVETLKNSSAKPVYQTQSERLARGERLYGIKKN